MGKDKVFHPTAIVAIPSSNFELGEAIAKMRYDQICELFSGFIFEVRKQMEGDKEAGRNQLADQCDNVIIFADVLADIYAQLTISSEPYMKEEFAKIPISTAVLNMIKERK